MLDYSIILLHEVLLDKLFPLIYLYIKIEIEIEIEIEREEEAAAAARRPHSPAMWARAHTANLRTKILDFGGLDSSRILSLRGGILMSIGNFPGNLQSTNLSSDYLSREIGRMPAT